MKYAIVGLVILAVIGGVVFMFSGDEEAEPIAESQQNANTSINTNTTEVDTTSERTSFTANEVAAHNTASDCWTIVEDLVYDITEYIPNHPGGDEILRACGADGTTLFKQRQTDGGETVGSGTPHSSLAESALQDLKIGELAN